MKLIYKLSNFKCLVNYFAVQQPSISKQFQDLKKKKKFFSTKINIRTLKPLYIKYVTVLRIIMLPCPNGFQTSLLKNRMIKMPITLQWN